MDLEFPLLSLSHSPCVPTKDTTSKGSGWEVDSTVPSASTKKKKGNGKERTRSQERMRRSEYTVVTLRYLLDGYAAVL